MSEKLKPATRPAGLIPVEAIDNPPPILDPSEAGVFDWAESLRDDLQTEGKLATVRGLVLAARAASKGDPVKAVRAVKSLYAPDGKAVELGPNQTDIPVSGRVSPSGRSQIKIFNHPIRPVMRWMGFENWSFAEAVAALKKMGVEGWWGEKRRAGILPTTLKDQLKSGRKGDDGWAGPMPKLSKDEIAKLRALRAKIAEEATGPEAAKK